MEPFPRQALGDLASSVDYGVTASANAAKVGPQFLRITDIQDDRVDWSTVPFCDATSVGVEAARLEVGDIVFARTGATTGKSFLLRSCPERAVFASYLIRVRPDRARVDPRYLYWYFQTPEYWSQITSSVSGTAQPGVNASKLKSLTVPTPSLPEQCRVADILDKADGIRRKRKEAIALTEEVLRSVFLEMFGDPVTNPMGWPSEPIEDLCARGANLVDGPFGSSLKPEHYVRDGVKVVRNWNIYDDRFDASEFKYISREKFEEIKRSEVVAGDVLLTTKGTVGDVCVAPDLEGPAVLSASGTVRLRLPSDHTYLPEFVVAQMVIPSFKRYLHKFEAGSAQQYLNLSAIRKMRLVRPPYGLQKRFAVARERVRVAGSRSAAAMLEANLLFNSLTERAFTIGFEHEFT